MSSCPSLLCVLIATGTMTSSCPLLLWSTYKTPSRPVLKPQPEDFDLDAVRLPKFLAPSSTPPSSSPPPPSSGPRRCCHSPGLHRHAREPRHPAPTPPSPSSSSHSSSAFTVAPGPCCCLPDHLHRRRHCCRARELCHPLDRHRCRVDAARPSPPCPGTAPSSRPSLSPCPPAIVQQTLSLSLSHSLCKFHFAVFGCRPI
jgi:hypothetical protein